MKLTERGTSWEFYNTEKILDYIKQKREEFEECEECEEDNVELFGKTIL